MGENAGWRQNISCLKSILVNHVKSNMNHFELRVLPSLWKQAISGNVCSILRNEIDAYHQFAKQPDTGESFRRYYAHLEPLHSYLAHTTTATLLAESSTNDFNTRVESSIRFLGIHNFFELNDKIAVLKGTIDLAHGDVLIKQIKNLPPERLKTTGLILIDYDSKMGSILQGQLGVNVLSLGSLPSLKDRYVLVACGLACAEYKSLNKEIIWWGIPFGMIYTYLLEKMLRANKVTLSGKLSSGEKRFEKSYLTVKHHHSFSHFYLDAIYSSTPLVEGFASLCKPKIRSFRASFYSHETLTTNIVPTTDKDVNLIRSLIQKKNQGIRLVSSASRIEKTCGSDYLSMIRNILESLQDISLVCFGKALPAEYEQLAFEYGADRIIFAGWCSPAITVRIIGLLDLFIDPFPFGAGMTFASAGYQRIPIVSTRDYVSSSPSSISILYSCYKYSEIAFNSPNLATWLFGTPDSMAKHAIEILKNQETFHCECDELHSIIKKVFVSPLDSVLAPSVL